MNVKKLAIIGAIALVVIGCVLAAGCTSNTTTQQTSSDDKIVGNWTFPYDDGNGVTGTAIDVIKKDGTGFHVIITEDGKRLQGYYPFTWKNNNDGTFSLTFKDSNSVTKMTYDASTDTYVDKEGFNVIHKRLDPITGIWFVDGKDTNGKPEKVTHLLKPDGTGFMIILHEDGSTNVKETTWTKNADGTYAIVISDGGKLVWTLDSAKEKITSSTGNILTKKFADSFYYLSILGPWYNPENKNLVTFNADGTGILNKGNEFVNFTWTIPEFGKFKLTYLDGDNKGKESIWTYDREKDTFTTGNLVKNVVLVRPTENVNGLTITKFTTEPIVGIWTGDSIDKNGTIANNIINADGTGVTITSYADGTAKVSKMTWKKNTDGTYAFDYSNGTKRVFTVDSTGKTLKTDDGRTKTKQFLDTASEASIVGGWYSKDNNTLAVFNADDTGFLNYQKSILPFTWKVKDNGNIEVTYTGGTWEDGTSIKGKVTVWSFDRNNNVLTSSYDTKYTRPTESIKDRITLN